MGAKLIKLLERLDPWLNLLLWLTVFASLTVLALAFIGMWVCHG